MTVWRRLAQLISVLIVLDLLVLQIVMTVQVSAAIADFEARTGGSADNDWGQRGLAIGALIVFVAGVIAALSIWNLSRRRASGFVLHALLWLVLLAVLGVRPLPDNLEWTRAIWQGIGWA